MSVDVCVLTGKGRGAISSILLGGQGAELILENIFSPVVSFREGGIFHGRLIESGQVLDEVVVGCEADNQFVIHCHGNPILVQKIVQLLIRCGAELTPFENTISANINSQFEKEAYIEQLKTVTIEGAKIIQSQINGGLSKTVKSWLDPALSLKAIQQQCRAILARSRIARLIIHGVKIVLAGPANSGKSTLLNTLAGSQKAIVSEIAGTTRDWVSAFIHIGPLRAEIIDTAGLGEDALHHSIDHSAQQRTLELINQCDCVLWIEDGANPWKGKSALPPEMPVIRVWNKADLFAEKVLKTNQDAIPVSAKRGQGIADLLTEIQKRLGVYDFDYTLAAAFTVRQEKLLEEIAASTEKEQIRKHLIALTE